MPEALVTPRVLQWARERRAFSLDELAESANVDAETLRLWESTEKSRPSLSQAARLAKLLRVPLGYLFLPSPPRYDLPIADLRTKSGKTIEDPSPDFQEVLNDALRKQEWYREYLQGEGFSRIPYVGSFNLEDSPIAIARSIREELGLDESDRRAARTPSEYLKILTERSEDAGVTVLRAGIVGNNTRRPLSVDEFRGFALPDEIAPLVFVNTQDYDSAQVFTLAHEISHIWLAAAGVSNLDPEQPTPTGELPDVELVCNQVSAELLVPSAEFRSLWRKDAPAESQVQKLSRLFHVSRFVVLRRALDLRRVESEEYWRVWESLGEAIVAKKKQSGGNFWNSFPLRNGGHLSAALIASALEGKITYREAASMLNVRVPMVNAAAERYGMA